VCGVCEGVTLGVVMVSEIEYGRYLIADVVWKPKFRDSCVKNSEDARVQYRD
jgi:hypothetical protein